MQRHRFGDAFAYAETEVYEKFEKYSRTAGNPIRIHYAFRLPEQEGVPAIEVLAEPSAKTA